MTYDKREHQKNIFKQVASNPNVPVIYSPEHYKADEVAEDRIIEASRKGLPKSQIAAEIGWSQSKLGKEVQKNDRIAYAIAKGRSLLTNECMTIVTEAVRGGDLRAACWLLGHLEKMESREENAKLRSAVEGTESGQTLIEMLIESRKRLSMDE